MINLSAAHTHTHSLTAKTPSEFSLFCMSQLVIIAISIPNWNCALCQTAPVYLRPCLCAQAHVWINVFSKVQSSWTLTCSWLSVINKYLNINYAHVHTHTSSAQREKEKRDQMWRGRKKSEISLKPFKWLLKIGAQCPLASHAVCIN